MPHECAQVVKPGGKLVVGVTKMHNAIFHIANNIKGFAAARLGAPEIDSPGMREGLPVIEIFRTTSTAANGRAVIARVDCVEGLTVLSRPEWEALDKQPSRTGDHAVHGYILATDRTPPSLSPPTN